MMTRITPAANPQGKGLVPVLDSLQQAKHLLQVAAKPLEQISNELFTSLFILNSQIRFKPTTRQTYWLYFKDQQYRLSLIAPGQWTPAKSGRYIGACELQADLTWTLDLSADSAGDAAFIAAVTDQRQQLEAKIRLAEKIEDVLPVYVQNLPFYARVLASALAYSLKCSMQQSGIQGMNFQQAQHMLLSHKENPA